MLQAGIELSVGVLLVSTQSLRGLSSRSWCSLVNSSLGKGSLWAGHRYDRVYYQRRSRLDPMKVSTAKKKVGQFSIRI
jgi:hypothetical protein